VTPVGNIAGEADAAPPEGPAGAPADLALPEEYGELMEPWTGDLDGMIERRAIRVLVVHNPMMYSIDGGEQRGVTYELLRELEQYLNGELKRRTLRVQIYPIPVPRDRLLPALVEGRGDVAAANLTITPERLDSVDFSDPLMTDVSEILVSGPSAPPVGSLEELSGRELYVRSSSSYHESLVELGKNLAASGRKPVSVRPASENLEDVDILEMVNAGLVPMTIVDSHKATFWAQVLDGIRLHPDLAVRRGGRIAWAFRKESPRLAEMLNGFVKRYKKGTLLGNVILQRYLKQVDWARNVIAEEELQKYDQVAELFERYAGLYEFEYLMIVAQAYQESGLDQSKRSRAGAVGIMQILPATAADPSVGIPGIEVLENNIHAGVKYLRFITDTYLDEDGLDPLNRRLLAFACYNAGPAKIRRVRRQAEQMGLDPDVWFENVEVAAARHIGREPVRYVGNIYKYYLAYQMTEERRAAQEAARQEAIGTGGSRPHGGTLSR
jgi:membrane-bound lytic murein transglycosylase MltF